MRKPCLPSLCPGTGWAPREQSGGSGASEEVCAGLHVLCCSFAWWGISPQIWQNRLPLPKVERDSFLTSVGLTGSLARKESFQNNAGMWCWTRVRTVWGLEMGLKYLPWTGLGLHLVGTVAGAKAIVERDCLAAAWYKGYSPEFQRKKYFVHMG